MSIKEIASFNVNGIRARLPRLLDWLKENAPDVVVLQEIKSTKEDFPMEAIESLGYNVELIGQKSFNGVAVLSKDLSKMSNQISQVMLMTFKPDG